MDILNLILKNWNVSIFINKKFLLLINLLNLNCLEHNVAYTTCGKCSNYIDLCELCSL